jgi:hypothetical protein
MLYILAVIGFLVFGAPGWAYILLLFLFILMNNDENR